MFSGKEFSAMKGRRMKGFIMARKFIPAPGFNLWF
jgi:hypothetical protein